MDELDLPLTVENLRKGENAGYQHFQLVYTSFKRPLFIQKVIKIQDLNVKQEHFTITDMW